MSATRHRRDERDLAARARRIAPRGEGAVDGDAQPFARQRESMARAQPVVERAQVARVRVDLFGDDAGGIAQAGEIQQLEADPRALPERIAIATKSPLPPC
jgi:hypothetical protein